MQALLPCALLALATTLPTTPETIEHIEFYGLRQVRPEQLTEVLGLDVGSEAQFDRDALMDALREVEGVDDATIVTMRSFGSTSATLVVGVLEEGSPRPALRPAPTGDARLPEVFLSTYDGIMESEMEGFRKGIGGSDEASSGHPLSNYAPTRELQDQLIERVAEHLDLLRAVVRESADPTHRMVAAHALGYAPDKQAVVNDLAHGMTDPDSGVRNNSVRALGVILRWSQAGNRGLVFDFDPSPLVAMLDSVSWTDRNKSSAILDSLSKERSPELFALLRERGLPALAEMAAWRSEGYALFSVRILARMAGDSEEELRARCEGFTRDGHGARQAWVARTVARLQQAP